MQDFKVIFYRKEDGTEPAKEFLLGLEVKMRAKMARTIKLLEDNGPALREPVSKPLGDGIFELRAKFSSDITRVLYFFFVGKCAVLTNGFVKKTQKTPPREIYLAKRYRDDFMQRQGER